MRVLVPATNDLPWIGMLSRTGYRQFLEAGVRIFEYGGPMIHAKTVVADGWWSKVGSTNLNLSRLAANWLIDLVAEDRRFGAKMEEMFEEDLDHAREIRLLRVGRSLRVRPDHQIENTDRGARRGVVGSGSGAAFTITRVGSTALQKSGAPVNTYENALAAAASGALLGSSVLAARFPRLVGWPLAATGGLLGGIGVLHAARTINALGAFVESRDSRLSNSAWDSMVLPSYVPIALVFPPSCPHLEPLLRSFQAGRRKVVCPSMKEELVGAAQ